MRYAYLHGFASGPLARKGLALAEAFEAQGAPFSLPDLNAPSFAELSHAAMLAAVDELTAGGEPWRFIGSSLGGWLAARWAELHPDRVDRLVLLCPGFGLGSRWPTLLGERAMKRWEGRGTHPFPDGAGEVVDVHWGFYQESLRQPSVPDVRCPTRLIHGRADEVVPIESSRRYAADRPHVELLEVDDDHPLSESLDRVTEESLRFFGLS
ncbi:MAG: alpha/beta fold hydrolase [Deltaproteobacteria bacterium]|nr:alpha/beta fold hydrolase [Deltaproteobacteria bacterium]